MMSYPDYDDYDAHDQVGYGLGPDDCPVCGAPPGEHHRHCTAGEIASELGYSVSYILAVKKAIYPNEATRPRRLDPVEISEWIYAHPSFRMRDVYECHSKDDPRQEHLAFEGV